MRGFLLSWVEGIMLYLMSMESPMSQILRMSLFFFNGCCCFPYNNGFIIVLISKPAPYHSYHAIYEVFVSCEIEPY